MVADVPVGVLLSGGLDSSLIVGLLARSGQEGLATFSVGFDDVGEREGNEFGYSDVIAEFQTDHHKIHVRPTGCSRPWTARSRDERADGLPRAVAFYLLSRRCRSRLKVVQSGQGADEVFAGYSWYPPLVDAGQRGRPLRDGVLRPPPAEFSEMLTPPSPTAVQSRASSPSTSARRRETDRPRATPRTEIMLVDDPVKRVDNMTMAWGLEARTPFLDHELVELAAACPPSSSSPTAARAC